jgi:hypothetical protein
MYLINVDLKYILNHLNLIILKCYPIFYVVVYVVA